MTLRQALDAFQDHSPVRIPSAQKQATAARKILWPHLLAEEQSHLSTAISHALDIGETFHYDHACAIYDGDNLLVRSSTSTANCSEISPSARAASSAVERLRWIAFEAERELVKSGVLKKMSREEP